MQNVWRDETKLVIGIDIGTTCSAVTTALLTKGATPAIQRVTSWPGQALKEAQAKLPSIILYEFRKPIKIGAEVKRRDLETAERQGRKVAKNFKLHLHPSDMAPPDGFELDSLPSNVSIQQIYTDFLRYLLDHTRVFFQDHTINGFEQWQTLFSTMQVVIAHPNGWATREQGVLRNAAMSAGWSTSAQQISFVPEAEASVLFCLESGVPPSLANANIIVCDAGGSTVDITVYRVIALEPKLRLKEMKVSLCIQAGGEYVDKAFIEHMTQSFIRSGQNRMTAEKQAKLGYEDFIANIKNGFEGSNEAVDLKVGDDQLDVPSVGIESGYMELPGRTVLAMFDRCVDKIVASYSSQASGVANLHTFLVGGFGDSPYLKKAMKSRLNLGNRLTISNKPGVKAVADGAVLWAIEESVESRVTRYSYGTPKEVIYDPNSSLHTGRKAYYRADGDYVVGDGWSELVQKGTPTSSGFSRRSNFCYTYKSLSDAPTSHTMYEKIYSTPAIDAPLFITDKSGDLRLEMKLECVVSATITDLKSLLTKRQANNGNSYWVLSFRMGVRFGGTQLRAFIEWDEGGRVQTGSATVIPGRL